MCAPPRFLFHSLCHGRVFSVGGAGDRAVMKVKVSSYEDAVKKITIRVVEYITIRDHGYDRLALPLSEHKVPRLNHIQDFNHRSVFCFPLNKISTSSFIHLYVHTDPARYCLVNLRHADILIPPQSGGKFLRTRK